MESVIGKFSVVSPGLTRIGEGNKPIYIGNDVFVGKNVKARGGINIGNGCIIAPCSVLEEDIPAYSLYRGNEVIASRYTSEIIQFLEELKWWNWTEEQCKENQWFFVEMPVICSHQTASVKSLDLRLIREQLDNTEKKILQRNELRTV